MMYASYLEKVSSKLVSEPAYIEVDCRPLSVPFLFRASGKESRSQAGATRLDVGHLVDLDHLVDVDHLVDHVDQKWQGAR